MWRLQSPPASGGGSIATGHVAIPETYRVLVLVPRRRGDTKAFPRRGRVWSRETRGDFGAFPCWVEGPVPRGTW
jgi:hypothetical protein